MKIPGAALQRLVQNAPPPKGSVINLINATTDRPFFSDWARQPYPGPAQRVSFSPNGERQVWISGGLIYAPDGELWAPIPFVNPHAPLGPNGERQPYGQLLLMPTDVLTITTSSEENPWTFQSGTED